MEVMMNIGISSLLEHLNIKKYQYKLIDEPGHGTLIIWRGKKMKETQLHALYHNFTGFSALEFIHVYVNQENQLLEVDDLLQNVAFQQMALF
jgi:hypothetical protein